MKRIGVWRIGSDGRRELAAPLEELRTTETEQRLEELLVASPDVLLPGLTLIGRQIETAGGPLDLLGIDREGALVLFELKRGTLTRDAVAQILDYASDLQSKSPDEFSSLVETSSGRDGIDRIDDFSDWYQGEFPGVTDLPPSALRLVLVGLGADERAKRVVNYLAQGGVDIQLLTFQAFRSGTETFLARQLETTEPTKASEDGASTKENNLRILKQRAAENGVRDLLFEVADFVQQHVPGYRWPGKTAVTFSLQERTDEGRPTLRAYASVWVDEKNHGQVIVSLPDRAIQIAPHAIEQALASIPSATRTTNSWMPFMITVTTERWSEVAAPLASLLAHVVEAWKRKAEEEAAADASDAAANEPKATESLDV